MKHSFVLLAASIAASGFCQELIWERSFTVPGTLENPSKVFPARGGGVFVLTTTLHSSGPQDWREVQVTRFAGNGTQMWQRLGTRGVAATVSVAEDSTDSLLIVSRPQFVFSTIGAGLTKLHASGSVVWSRGLGEEGSFFGLSVNSDDSIVVCADNRTRLYSPAGAVIWDVGGSGRITRKNADEVFIDNGTTVAVFDLSGLVRTFSAGSSTVGAAIPGGAYVRGEGSVVRAYDEFGAIQWFFDLDADCRFLSADSTYLMAVTDSSVYWLDHQGNMLRQTASAGAPSQAYLDGLGGALFRGSTSRDRHTRHYGVVAIEPDPPHSMASGTQSDLYTAEWEGEYVVRRYRAGVDHHQATLTRGNPIQHSHWALMHSGDGYWRLGPGATLSSAQAPVSVLLNYFAPPEPPSQMGFIIESRASASAIRQTVEAFDVQANAWVVIEGPTQLPTGGSPDRYKILGMNNPENFIDPVTRRVRIRIEYRAVGPVLAFPWQASIDRTMLRYVKEESK